MQRDDGGCANATRTASTDRRHLMLIDARAFNHLFMRQHSGAINGACLPFLCSFTSASSATTKEKEATEGVVVDGVLCAARNRGGHEEDEKHKRRAISNSRAPSGILQQRLRRHLQLNLIQERLGHASRLTIWRTFSSPRRENWGEEAWHEVAPKVMRNICFRPAAFP